MMVLLTIAGRASSQVSFSVDPITISAGEEKVVDIKVSISGTYLACQFDLLLPEGISIKSDELGYLAEFVPKNKRAEDHTAAVSSPSDNLYRFVISSNNNKSFILGDKRDFVSLTLVAASDVTSGVKNAKIQNALFSISNTEDFKPENYEFAITIQGKPTVTADNKSREYGADNPELTYTVDPEGSDVGTLTLTTTAEVTSPVGDYTITVPTGEGYNAVNGTLTVTKAPLTISGGTYTIKQGEALPSLAPEYAGFKNGETSNVLTTQPTLAYETEVTSASAPGTYYIAVSGATADNYEISYQQGTLTITAADPVTVTAKSYEITYGDELPNFGYDSEGATLTGTPTISCGATADSDAGTYEIVIEKGNVTNYNDTYVNGTLTIKPAPLTIKVTDEEKKYGEDNPNFKVNYTGFVKDQNESVLTGTLAFNTEATAASGVGSYDVTASGLTSTNYAITYEKGSLKVNKATLKVTAKDASVKQGEATPTLEIDYDGFVNGDDVNSLTTAPTATTDRELSSAPGSTFTITVSGGSADNYDFTYVNGTLSVTEADPVTVTANSYTIKYGDDLPTFEYASTGATLNGTPAITCEASKTSPVGTYDIVIAKGTVTNYNDTYVNGTLTIEKAPLTAKAKSISVEQGVATPTLEIEYTGFKNNETETVLDTKPTASTARTVDSEPGNYDITVVGGEDNNYEITTQNGTLTVTAPAKVIVTVTNCERKYGEENPTFAYTVSGGTLSGEPVLACSATKTSAPGEYDITIAQGTIANYSYELVGGKLTVKPAPLTITADNKTKAYGEALPQLTYTITGFVNDETEDVVTTKPTITTTATAESATGQYPITVADAVAANYEISYVSGTLTVTGKNLTLNVSLNPSNYTYDGSAKTPTVTVTAADNTTITEADYELSGDLSATNAGTYTITATPKGNYSGSAVSANWSIEASTTIDGNGNTITEDGTNVTLESASSNDIAEDGGLTVPDGITQISNTAFSSIDKSGVEYVDLSNTNVSGVTVDRQSGVFNGFSDNTIIYVPSGNTAATGETNVVVDGTCQELNLSEGQGMVIPTGFMASKVTYARPLTVEKASTFCLPYSLTSDETLGFYELSSSTADALIFSEVTSTEPNKPYLAIPKIAGATFGKSISTAISSNKNLDGAEQSITGFKMIGTMKAISHADALNKFILQDDNKWHQVTSASATAAAIGAYRAFIERTALGGSARQYSVAVDADGTTAIKTLQTIDADGTERWYDLNGHRLQGKPTQKGTYIVNGKKVVK